MAGYSARSLTDKLGITLGMHLYIQGAPDYYIKLLHPLPIGCVPVKSQPRESDFVQFFTTSLSRLEKEFPRLSSSLSSTGMIWICWPKATSKIKKDITENQIREIGLANGLVDVKVIAIDADWSGLKFVYRLKDR